MCIVEKVASSSSWCYVARLESVFNMLYPSLGGVAYCMMMPLEVKHLWFWLRGFTAPGHAVSDHDEFQFSCEDGGFLRMVVGYELEAEVSDYGVAFGGDHGRQIEPGSCACVTLVGDVGLGTRGFP